MPLTRYAAAGIAAFVVLAAGTVSAQDPDLTGKAALDHPAVQLAVKAAGLITAGKIDEAMALGTKESVDEWKALSAGDRAEMTARLARITPDPDVFARAVTDDGTLAVMGDTAIVNATIAGGRAIAYFQREDGAWRITNGPMAFPAEPDPGNEVRLEGEEILDHPIGPLALQFLDLIHAGNIEGAKALATADVQARWKGEPASERAESLAYLRKNLPTRADVTAGLQTGTGGLRGVLIIEEESSATLNLIQSSQTSPEPGTTTFSSSTMTIGFAMEGGQWRLAQ